MTDLNRKLGITSVADLKSIAVYMNSLAGDDAVPAEKDIIDVDSLI